MTSMATEKTQVRPGDLVEATTASNKPRTIRVRVDREPWPVNDRATTLSDGKGIVAVLTDSIRVVEANSVTAFNPATLVVTPDHVHALAQPVGDVLAWDHNTPGGEVRAMTRREAISAGFVAFTNRGWLNDWTREEGCWNDDHSDVTQECAESLANVLTEWLRRIA